MAPVYLLLPVIAPYENSSSFVLCNRVAFVPLSSYLLGCFLLHELAMTSQEDASGLFIYRCNVSHVFSILIVENYRGVSYDYFVKCY